MKPKIAIWLVVVTLSVTAFHAMADVEKKYLVMKLANCNQSVCFSLDVEPEISFDSECLTVTCKGSDGMSKADTRNYYDVEEFHFEFRTDALQAIKLKNEVEFQRQDADNLLLRAIGKDIYPIVVYDIQGHQMDCCCEKVSDDVCTVDFGSLEKDIYIIVLKDNSSIKILKK